MSLWGICFTTNILSSKSYFNLYSYPKACLLGGTFNLTTQNWITMQKRRKLYVVYSVILGEIWEWHWVNHLHGLVTNFCLASRWANRVAGEFFQWAVRRPLFVKGVQWKEWTALHLLYLFSFANKQNIILCNGKVQDKSVIWSAITCTLMIIQQQDIPLLSLQTLTGRSPVSVILLHVSVIKKQNQFITSSKCIHIYTNKIRNCFSNLKFMSPIFC